MSDDLITRLMVIGAAYSCADEHIKREEIARAADDARIAALEAERDRLRDALKPFERMGATFVNDDPRRLILDRTFAPVDGPAFTATLCVKHFHAARAALVKP